MWKNILRIGVPGLIIIFLLGMNIQQKREYKKLTKDLLERIDILTQVISQRDSTLSYYSKMVDNFDVTERDLRKQLSKINKEFAEKIKDSEERILSLSEYNIELHRKIDTFAIENAEIKDGVLTFDIQDYYPDEKNYFIKYTGYVQAPVTGGIYNPVIAREFSFNPIKINMVMTETTKGAWKYNILDAPEWIALGSMEVLSLPPSEYKPASERGMQYLVGGGILKMYQGRSYLTLSAGAEYKGWQLLGTGGVGGIQATILKKLNKE